jgi:hypothetical protein
MHSKLFDLEKVEVTGGWRKLHDEQLHNFLQAGRQAGKVLTKKTKYQPTNQLTNDQLQGV